MNPPPSPGSREGYNGFAMLWRSRQRIGTDEARRLVPLRAPHAVVREEGDDLVLTIHRTPGRITRIAAWFFTLPPTRSFRLDPFGARVWHLTDGARTVGAIAATLAGEHGWATARAEEAVLIFLGTLSERHLIRFG